MKTIFFSIVILLTINISINAQNLIAVQNGGNPTFYLNLNDAINNANSGDTLYLPGGSFNITAIISKPLHLIGAGHNPDSTLATYPTYITGNICLKYGASGGSMTGIIALNQLYFGYASDTSLHNYTISRCNILSITSLVSYNWSNSPSNNLFIENIIGYVSFAGGESNFFYNNILLGLTGIGSNNIVKNNIFLTISGNALSTGYYRINSSTFENNIFIATTTIYSQGTGYFSNNIFSNNLFVQNISFPYASTNMGFNDIVNQTQSSIFINQSGSFSYAQDYHLQPTCLGKNAGKDGTDIGIYGGVYPWKAGSVPFNPHLQRFNISGSTNSNGALPVNIKVEAQDH